MEQPHEIPIEKRQFASGLVNFGSTCYFNSVLQALVATSDLTSYLTDNDQSEGKKSLVNDIKEFIINNILRNVIFKKKNIDHDTDDYEITEDDKKIIAGTISDSVAFQMKNFFVEMQKSDVIRPMEIAKCIFEKIRSKNSDFHPANHNDSHEVLLYVLDFLHCELQNTVHIKIKLSERQLHHKQIYKNYMKIQDSKEIGKEIKKQSYIDYVDFKKNKISDDLLIQYLYFRKTNSYEFDSVISDLFCSIDLQCVLCSGCSNISAKFSVFKSLELHVGEAENNTLYSLLDEHYNKEEALENDDKYDCEYCGEKKNALRKVQLWNASKYLIITFKRYSKKLRKNSEHIEYPIEDFDMSKYFAPHAPLAEQQNCKYNLYGMITHNGGLDFGHYSVITKNPHDSQWTFFNDERVVQLNIDSMQQIISRNSPYILLYEKK